MPARLASSSEAPRGLDRACGGWREEVMVVFFNEVKEEEKKGGVKRLISQADSHERVKK